MSHTKKPTIEKIILALLGLLALAALVRTMFLGLEIDEEYALSLGFRLVRGDRLFYSMWEPHQLAALPPALLIGLFTAVTGTTTGVLLFVRGAVLAVKLALAVWFYRSLRVALGGRCAYLLALAVLAFTPKWFLGPDYVSQQFHFTAHDGKRCLQLMRCVFYKLLLLFISLVTAVAHIHRSLPQLTEFTYLRRVLQCRNFFAGLDAVQPVQ